MSLINQIMLIIGAIFAGFAAAFKLGMNNEKNSQNKNTLINVRKAKKIEENINKLTRDQRIDRM